MKFIADFHVHSPYSRATSRRMSLPSLHSWAQRKGLRIVGTGDFTHPRWMEDLRTQLAPDDHGLYRLAPELAAEADRAVPASCRMDVSFILTVEISNIYKKDGKTRKVHNLIFARDLSTAAKIAAALQKVGNIMSDGRPILGLDSKDLLAIVLEHGRDAFLVPAHAWTPHFSVLGAFSGFGSIEECYEDLSHHIFAIETGLSSDPAMNWRVSSLDRFALMSNSDAHSPEKLAREANLFDTEPTFDAIKDALAANDGHSFLGTLEFFPQEGKYHYDGHRVCGARLAPEETERYGGLCPACGRKVTLGVCHRVAKLADRPEGAKPDGKLPFERLIPLREVLSEVVGTGPASRRVTSAYGKLLTMLGSELHILRKASAEQLESAAIPGLSEAIRRVRAGEVHIAPGYDGEYGTIKIFAKPEREAFSRQGLLF